MAYRRSVIACAAGLLLAGCGGGGSGNYSNPFGPYTPPPTSATTTQSIGAAGGAITTTLNGTGTTVTVPAGAFATAANVKVTVFVPTSSPQTIAGTKRSPRTLPDDKIPVIAVQIDAGTTPLLKPLKISATLAPPFSGSVYRLAGYGTTKSFTDVDTTTYANGTVTEDLNPAYSGPSLAQNTLYGFYVTAKPAPAPTFTVAVAGPAADVALTTAQYTASEADDNGFPYLWPTAIAFSADPAIGTMAAGTGLLNVGSVDAVGNVSATDTATSHASALGKLQVAITSQRPGSLNDTFTFSGQLSTTTQLTNPNITTQPQTDTASVSLTSKVTGFTATAGGGQSSIHSDEVDTYPLQTISTGTDSVYAYATAGLTSTLSIVSSDAKDSNGVEYINQYLNGNGLLDVLPEATGSFGPNTAALKYTEKDPANYARTRMIAADGTYVETGTDPFGDVQTITNNADFSALYDATQYSGFKFAISAPSGSPAKITIALMNRTRTLATYRVPSWIPAGTTKMSSETDVDNGSTTYPASCSVPAKYGTAGNQLVQTINRIDPALGNVELQTTTTYLAPGVGPVCIQLSDTVQTFYDYTLQNGYIIYMSGTKPIQLTSASETLTLQSAQTQNGTVTSSINRGTSSAVPRSAFAPVAFARARFERAVRDRLGSRKATFSRSFLSQGVQAL